MLKALNWLFFSFLLWDTFVLILCESDSTETSNSTIDYDFEEVLNRHKRQCACLSSYTPVNCKCQQADPSNSNDLSCRCDRATVSPQCSCAPSASNLCFPVCQQQCIQSCVAQQQTLPQCQPPCQLICQRACQTLPTTQTYAALPTLQIGQPSQTRVPLSVAPNTQIIYAIPQSAGPTPQIQQPIPNQPVSNGQSIGQAAVFLPTQAQCIPLCIEQCVKNCPNSAGQCAQTCTNGCQAACNRPPQNLQRRHSQNEIVAGCTQRCEPSCEHACSKLSSEEQHSILLSTCLPACVSMCESNCQVNQPDPPFPTYDNTVLVQTGNRDTITRAPEEIVIQASPSSNDFNTRTIFEHEYFIPLDGSTRDIVIPISLPSQKPQQTLEINLKSTGSNSTLYYQVPINQSKVYEVPTYLLSPSQIFDNTVKSVPSVQTTETPKIDTTKQYTESYFPTSQQLANYFQYINQQKASLAKESMIQQDAVPNTTPASQDRTTTETPKRAELTQSVPLFISQSAAPPNLFLQNSYAPTISKTYASPYYQYSQQSNITSTGQRHPKNKEDQKQTQSPKYRLSSFAHNDKLSFNIEFPSKLYFKDPESQRLCESCPFNCSRYCIQQISKAFKIKGSEAQSFFRKRYSKLKKIEDKADYLMSPKD